jgi:hypothetical protein
MRAWITKYALSRGIIEVEGIEDSEYPGSLAVKSKNETYLTSYFWGKEWHTSLFDAVIRADDMRKAKIKALTRQLERLKALRFEVEG